MGAFSMGPPTRALLRSHICGTRRGATQTSLSPLGELTALDAFDRLLASVGAHTPAPGRGPAEP
jgi:hypothetical protein